MYIAFVWWCLLMLLFGVVSGCGLFPHRTVQSVGHTPLARSKEYAAELLISRLIAQLRWVVLYEWSACCSKSNPHYYTDTAVILCWLLSGLIYLRCLPYFCVKALNVLLIGVIIIIIVISLVWRRPIIGIRDEQIVTSWKIALHNNYDSASIW